MGGRTALDQLVRIFIKEKTEGDKRVLPVLRRGDRGVTFCNAWNKAAEYPKVWAACNPTFRILFINERELLIAPKLVRTSASRGEGSAGGMQLTF